MILASDDQMHSIGERLNVVPADGNSLGVLRAGGCTARQRRAERMAARPVNGDTAISCCYPRYCIPWHGENSSGRAALWLACQTDASMQASLASPVRLAIHLPDGARGNICRAA